ncbi:MAG: ATP-binding cassette domain-containing protein [Bacteroidaceae bacterium]|nr:ATP-binding cassette domain-containing protein [Bacteroidaceae bacterium]
MLNISGATLRYGNQTIFKNISLKVSRGELVGITGESGCGKTSLIRAILGFAPSEGSIIVDETPLCPNTVEEIRTKIAYLPQELSLPVDTVEEMVRLTFELKANRGTTFSKEALMSDWNKLNLSPALFNKHVSEVSGGQRQRILLSAAGLLGKPLLLADEPTSALDATASEAVADYLRMLADERNTAVVVVTHSDMLADRCDRCLKL